MRCASVVAVGLLTSFAGSQGQVWVVNDHAGPGVDFVSLQAAVDAAASGDLILVQPGQYGAVTIEAKALTIVGVEIPEQELPPQGVYSLAVRNLPALSSVEVRGVRILSSFTLALEQNQGTVWLEDIYTFAPILVEESTAVLTRCFADGGVQSESSEVYIYDTTVEGDQSEVGFIAIDSIVSASGSQIIGGPGYPGDSSPFGTCSDGGPGATGLSLQSSVFYQLDTIIEGGPGGPPGGPTCSAGPGGAPAVGETFVPLTGEAHTLKTNSPVFGGETLHLDFGGMPGEHAFAVVSTEVDPLFLAILHGPLLPKSPWALLFLGVVPPSGKLSLAVPVSDPVTPGAVFFVQGAFVHPSTMGPDFLGSASAVEILQSVFVPDDCDGDGITDIDEFVSGLEIDCNANGVPDSCDVAAGTSQDCNTDGLPDECLGATTVFEETALSTGPISSTKWLFPPSDAPWGASSPVTEPSWPWAIELEGGEWMQTKPLDLSSASHVTLRYAWLADHGFEKPDAGDDLFVRYLSDSLTWVEIHQHLGGGPVQPAFEQVVLALPSDAIHAQTSIEFRATSDSVEDFFVDDVLLQVYNSDCNANGAADSCDLASGISSDLDGDGFPDECYADCNANAVNDLVDIVSGTSNDLNANHVPDECEGVAIFYVDDDAPFDPGPGDPTVSDPLEDGSALHPFDSVQEAIGPPVDGNIVELRNGVYTGAGNREIHLAGKSLTVRSANGPSACIIDCQLAGRAFALQGGDSGKLVGLTIRNGRAGLPGGGAVNCAAGSAATLTGCVLRGNSAVAGASGGAIYTREAEIVVEACSITGNSAVGSGGGIYAGIFGSVSIVDSVIAQNVVAGSYSGGHTGGGVSISLVPDAEIRNCTIADNFVATDGTASLGGGLAIWADSSATITSTILWGNVAGDGGQLYYGFDCPPGAISYSDVQGGHAGITGTGPLAVGPGGMKLNPLFAGPGNYHLTAGSPCIDAGDPSYVPAPGTTDIDGQARIAGAAVDIGADEFHP